MVSPKTPSFLREPRSSEFAKRIQALRSLLLRKNVMTLSEKKPKGRGCGAGISFADSEEPWFPRPFKIDPKDIKTYLLYNNSNYVSEVKIK